SAWLHQGVRVEIPEGLDEVAAEEAGAARQQNPPPRKCRSPVPEPVRDFLDVRRNVASGHVALMYFQVRQRHDEVPAAFSERLLPLSNRLREVPGQNQQVIWPILLESRRGNDGN